MEGLKEKKQRLQARLKLLHASIGADTQSNGEEGQPDDSDCEYENPEPVRNRILPDEFIRPSVCMDSR